MKILFQLFSLKFITALLGLAYSILQVKYFGASRVIEIYFAAQSLVYLVTSLTQSGQLAEVFLPEYHKLNAYEEKLGYEGLNVVITRMLLWGGVLIFFVFLLAPYFMDLLVPGFSIEDKEKATLIFRVLLPYLFLQLVNSFFITVLNADQKFGKAELLGLTNTIVNIIVLVILYQYIKIWALVVSLLLGKLIESLFYIFNLYKNGYRFKFLLSLKEFNHVNFFKTMQSTFLYVGATQFYSIVLTASISFLPEGIYAIFKYVQNLVNKIRGVFIQPFLTIFFTKFSLLLQNSKSVVSEFTKNIISIINVNVIVIIGALLLGDVIIDLIWGGKKFDKLDVQLAYIFLLFNIAGLLFSSIGSVYRKMAVAQGLAKKLYLFWVVAQLLTAACTFLLIKYFNIRGLYFIIPINSFLIGFVSFMVYKKSSRALTFNFFNKNIFISLGLVAIAIVLKYVLEYRLFNISYYLTSIFLIVTVLILSLPPVISTYKILKK